MENSWIRLHRKLMDDPLYFAEPFTKMQAWIDLLLLANFADRVTFIRGNRVTIKRGQVAYSREWFSGRWRWSRGQDRPLSRHAGTRKYDRSTEIGCNHLYINT